MKKIILMKTIFYFLLVIFMTSCSFYKVTGQSPYQYTSVSEQVIVNDFYDEPFDVQNVYINYTPTFSFVDYYSWYWWRPNRRFYYWMYPTTNYWGWNSWNSWNGWNYYNSWGWNSWNNYGYYPYYLNNWSYYNNLYHPYTYNPYFYHPNQGFNNFNPGCHSPFYKQNTQSWKKSLNQPQVNLQKIANNKTNYSSIKPQPVRTLSDNSPRRNDNFSQKSYERPKQDLRIYNEQRYNTPSRNTETRTYTKPEPVRYESKPTRTEYRQENRTIKTPRYETQRNNYQPKTRVESPRYDYPSSNRPSYNQSPRISSPSSRPSRSTYQPRTNYGVKGGR